MALPEDSDHARAAREYQAAILQAMTPEQRIQREERKKQTMLHLLAVGFRHRNPTWTETEVQRAVADSVLRARTV